MLKEDMKRIEDKLDSLTNQSKKGKKEPKFILPKKAKVSFTKAKKNYVILMKVNSNNNVDFKKVQINEQVISEDGVPRLATKGSMLFYKKMPLIVLPKDSTVPVDFNNIYENSLNNGSNIAGYKLLMNAMKLNTVDEKKKVGNGFKIGIGVVVALIIGYALLTGGN